MLGHEDIRVNREIKFGRCLGESFQKQGFVGVIGQERKAMETRKGEFMGMARNVNHLARLTNNDPVASLSHHTQMVNDLVAVSQHLVQIKTHGTRFAAARSPR